MTKRSLWTFVGWLFFGVPATTQTHQALNITVRVIDGRNGRPRVGTSAYVNVWVGGERKEAIAIPTDEKGVARLQLTLNPSEVNIPNSKNTGSIVVGHPVVKYDEFFRINAPYVLCGPGGGNYSWLELKNFSTKEVLDHGYASANTCGKVTIPPHPGEVIFIRQAVKILGETKAVVRNQNAWRVAGGRPINRLERHVKHKNESWVAHPLCFLQRVRIFSCGFGFLLR